jgi:phosphate-selective porin OprO/OprP
MNWKIRLGSGHSPSGPSYGHWKIRLCLGLFAAFCIASAAKGQSDGSDSTATKAEAGPNGFALASSDGQWRLRFRGLIQLDGRVFTNDSAPAAADTWLLRRVRPSLEGSFGERLAFRVVPDLGGGTTQLIDAYIDTKLGERLSLRAGKFKPPVGLARLQSASDLGLVERSSVSELLPNRDVGWQLSGGKRLSWAVGLFNGVADGRSADLEDDGQPEFAARLFSRQGGNGEGQGGLGFGIAATYGRRSGAPATPLLSAYRSPGQLPVFGYRVGQDGSYASGDRLRVVPQFYWYRGPFGLLGEWARIRQDVSRAAAGVDRSARLADDAWQLTGEWLVTGERAGYRDPTTPGAVELVGRLADLEIDPLSFAGGPASFADPAVAVRRARTAAVGVNWFPLPGLKASLAYHRTRFEGGAPSAGDRADVRVILIQVQESF